VKSLTLSQVSRCEVLALVKPAGKWFPRYFLGMYLLHSIRLSPSRRRESPRPGSSYGGERRTVIFSRTAAFRQGVEGRGLQWGNVPSRWQKRQPGAVAEVLDPVRWSPAAAWDLRCCHQMEMPSRCLLCPPALAPRAARPPAPSPAFGRPRGRGEWHPGTTLQPYGGTASTWKMGRKKKKE